MLESLDSHIASAVLHWAVNLVFPFPKVVIRLYAQEFNETLQLIQIILHWCSSQTPPILTTERIASLSRLGVAVLDCMGFIKNNAVPMKTKAANFEAAGIA